MDPGDVIIAMALEAAFERKRQEKRRMQELLRARQVALREKGRERAMLMRKKQVMLAKEAAKQKLVDDFMVFIEAIERNDMENAQNFDEKAMMNTILTMMSSDGGHSGDHGGFAADYGDTVFKTGLNLGEKAMADVIVAKKNSDDDCGGNNGGFTGYNGGINYASETAQNLGEEATVAAIKGTKSDGSNEGGDAGGYGGGCK